MSNIKIKLGNLTLKNPIMLASGTFNSDILKKIDINRLGAIVTKTITLKQRPGNPLPHIYKTKYGWLNSVGLKNPGIEKYLTDELPSWLKYKTKIISSIGGETQEEYVQLAKILENTDSDAIEINVSCPNVAYGCISFGSDPLALKRLTSKVRKAYSKTLIVKLTPNVTDIVQLAQAALEGGAEVLTIANTFLALEIRNKKPIFKQIVAGYSGLAVKPITLRMVWQVYKKFKCPIIGCGGIEYLEDALDYIYVGAQAVAIGSANLIKPDTSLKMIDDLEKFMVKNNYKNINKIRGII